MNKHPENILPIKLDLTISKSSKLQLINLIFGTSQSINLTPLKKQLINTVY